MAIFPRLAPPTALLAALAFAASPVTAEEKGLTELTVPPKVAAAQFGSSTSLTCPDYGVVGTVSDGLVRAAKERGQAAPPADGRLCAAANVLLAWKTDQPPPSHVLLFLSRSVGLLGTPQQVMLNTIETDEPRNIARALSGSVLDFSAKAVAPRYGLATKRLNKTSTRVVVLVQDTPYELAPLPRQLPLNGTATLSGTVLGEYEKPAVVIGNPDGKAEEPAQAPGKAFKAELRCGERPGTIQVELRASLAGAPRSLARIPVACGGGPLPTTLSLEEKPWPDDLAVQAKLIFDQVNAERAGAGLAALTWEPALAGVAQELAVDLANQQLRGVAPGLSVTDRLAKVEMGSPVVIQNPGQSITPRLAAETFLESAHHRANLMNKDVTAGGVGVVQEAGPDGKQVAFVIELFTQVLAPVDAAKVRAEVRAGLIKRRAEAKATPVTSDPVLEKVAQAYAEALAAAGGELSDARSDELTMSITRQYKTINLVPGAKADPMEFTSEPALLGKAGKGLGVGAALGKHPVLGKNAPYVVVLIATKR